MGAGGTSRFAVIAGAMLAMIAGGSSTAWAADYHAAPGGSGSACSSGSPCTLPTAVGQANTAGFGRILLAAGTYSPGSTLNVTGAVDLGPEPGAANPTIHGPGTGNVLNITNGGAVLHDVFLTENGGNPGLRLVSGTAERVFVTVTGGSPACAPVDGATLRDSVCWANGTGNNAAGVWVVPPSISPSTGNLFNVTAIGGENGIQVNADVSGEVMTLNMTNVIAKGGVADVSANASSGGVTHAILDHSSYATVAGATITPPGTGGNQTAAPLLANLAGGDFHELPGSPTIDAGTTAPGMGSLDADRHARIQSACTGGVAIPDIGAYEASAPIAAASCSRFVVGALRLNKRQGTGRLTVNVPGAGVLKAAGKGLKTTTAKTSSAGDVVLKLRAKGRARAALDNSGRVKLKVGLTWAPTGNTGSSQTDKVKLKKS